MVVNVLVDMLVVVVVVIVCNPTISTFVPTPLIIMKDHKVKDDDADRDMGRRGRRRLDLKITTRTHDFNF